MIYSLLNCVLIMHICLLPIVTSLDPSTANNYEAECSEVTSNDICLIKYNKGNCQLTAAYPFMCVSSLKQIDSKCDLVLAWTVQENVIDFSLTKSNYQLNEWIGVIFSKKSIKSDIVIGVIPARKEVKIINGVIQGYDVILNEDSKSSNYIFNKQIAYSNGRVEIKFSRELSPGTNESSGNMVDLNDCLSDQDGVSMFLLNGSLSSTGEILFNSTSAPRSIGPYCFNSCGEKISHLKESVYPVEDEQMLVDIEINGQTTDAENMARNFEIDQTSSVVPPTEMNFDTTFLNIASNQEAKSLTTTGTLTSQKTETDIFITPRANPGETTQSVETTFQITEKTSIASIELIPAQTTVISTEPATSTDTTTRTTTPITTTTSTTTASTTASTTSSTSTTTTTSTSTTTTASTTTTVFKPECPYQKYPFIDKTNKSFQFEINQLYDKTEDSVNFTFVIKNPSNLSQYAIFAVNDDRTQFIIYGDIDDQGSFQTFNELSSLSQVGFIELNENETAVTFALPRTFKFTTGLELRDCSIFRVYFFDQLDVSSNINTRSSKFLEGIQSGLYKDSVTTNQVCLKECCLAPKESVDVYMQMNILNREWSNNYSNLSSPESLFLINEVNSTIANQFNLDLKCYLIARFQVLLLREIPASSKKRSFAGSTILVSFKMIIGSANSGPITRENILISIGEIAEDKTQVLNFNSLTVSDSLLPTITTTVTVAITTTLSTQSSADSDYSKKLAIALSLSLIATLIIMGGALFGFLYWRKSKLNQSSSSSQNRSILRSLGNRFSGTAYKAAPAVRLDGIPPNNYTNDDFELQHYDNETFDPTEGYQNFTDFSGSREVGIDVGPFEINRDANAYNRPIEIVDNPKHQVFDTPDGSISNLVSMTREILHQPWKTNQEEVLKDLQCIEEDHVAESMNGKSNNYELDTDKIDVETIQDEDNQKDMSREDFDDLFNQRFSAILDDKKFETLFENNSESKKLNLENNYEEDEDANADEANEIDENDFESMTETESNLFGNIEKNLPELFGQSASNQSDESGLKTQKLVQDLNNDFFNGNENVQSAEIDKRPKRAPAAMGFTSSSNAIHNQSDISSVEMEFTEDEYQPDSDSLTREDTLKKEAHLFAEGLNLSLKSSLEEDNDDFKAIEINAIKSLKLSENNNFVIGSQTTTFKQMMRVTRDSSSDEEEKDSLNDSLDNEEDDNDSDTENENEQENKSLNSNLADFTAAGFPNPRSCRISMANTEEGLGIHLCGTKNHMIKDIELGSPAEKGGLKPGDKILVIDNENVEEADYTTIVDMLKDSMMNKRDIDLLVMNIIEYNVFKEKSPVLQNLNKSKIETDGSLSSNSHHIIGFGSDTETNHHKDDDEDEDLTKSSNSSNNNSDFHQTKPTGTDIENFVNAEFNPFHDVPNEMFSPFLHYSSIPPPPVSFQGDPQPNELFPHDQNPFDVDQFNMNSSSLKIKQDSQDNNNQLNIYDTNSEDLSENSTTSSNNRQSDFFLTSPNHLTNNLVTNNASNFDEDFLKDIPTKAIKNLNELIMTQSTDNGKMFQSQEYAKDISEPSQAFANWNDMLGSDLSENNGAVTSNQLNRERF